MYSFMGGGLFCAIVGNILLVVSMATDYWMQYRLSGSFAHQGLWRYCMSGKCYTQTDSIAYWNATRAFMILSAMSCFAGIIAGILSFAHFSAFERFNRSFAAGIMFFISTLFVLLAMAIYTGVTVNFLGKRFGDWRFSWSYILGWVALLMTFFAGQYRWIFLSLISSKSCSSHGTCVLFLQVYFTCVPTGCMNAAEWPTLAKLQENVFEKLK
uniref:Lens fiber membrane intrinsic protein n=1 Tax=Cyprinus carpio TaxID=7962 RepID=A0A8C1TGB2_CYPCA